MIREVPVPADLFHALDEAHDFENRDTLLWPLSRIRAWLAMLTLNLLRGDTRFLSI